MMKHFRYTYTDRQGKTIGQTEIQAQFASHHAFFCQVCGEIWASIIADDPFTTWRMNIVPCANHRPTSVEDWITVPGSILHWAVDSKNTTVFDRARALDNLPDAVVRLEFEAHLSNYYYQQGDRNEAFKFEDTTTDQPEPTPEHIGASNIRPEGGAEKQASC